MRLSQLFGRTMRQPPAEAETASHRLLVQAGLVAQLAAGIYSYLPLAWKVLRKIEDIVREEMDAAGGQELHLPALHPLEIWQASGRHQTMRDVLFHVQDKRGREFVLGPTHEEVITDLFKRYVRSYRDLPLLVYQIQTKFRDEPRPRAGLIRLREFIMKDLYSFDADWEGLDVSYQKMLEAYARVFQRCGVPAVPVLADAGAMGGRDTHEFMYLTDVGEDSCLFCPACGYAANAEVATFRKLPVHADEPPRPLEEVHTPGVTTIAQLARFLGVPESRTCKAVFYMADGRPVLAAVRGDMDVNQTKLKRAIGAVELHYMAEDEVARAGLVAGSASAVGLEGTIVVADDLLLQERNLVAGANRPDYHLLNVNYGRDWQADVVADIALAGHGHPCPQCGEPLELRRGVELGQVFKLGTHYSEKMGATFLDRDGQRRPAIMGCYGIGIDRLLAVVVEANHDKDGIIWPRELAPYRGHLVAIAVDRPEVREVAEEIYRRLKAAGLEPLYDDREETPGVKLKDADLLGMPLRITVSPRTLERGAAELKLRSSPETRLVPLEEVVQAVAQA
jgi:prolyl-tRNA synthetase